MIERIFKNWKTSLVGLVVLIAPIVLVALGKASLQEVGVFMVAAVPLFFSKDSLLGNGGGSAMLLLMAMLASCKCVPPSVIEVRDTLYTEHVRLDTAFLFRRDVVRDTIVKTQDKVRLRIMKVYDTVKVEAECLPDTVVKTKLVSVPARADPAAKPFWRLWWFPVVVILALSLALTITLKS